ncbi:MAG: Ig-like domain-containing protein [Solirubrobacteraceae bacterium]
MRRRGIVLAIVLGSFFSLSASSALATTGSYEVSACNYAPEGVNNSWSWVTTDPSQPDHYAEHANCPYRLGGNGGTADQEGGLSTTDALGLSSGAQPGTSAGWTFTAAKGTKIGGITYERYIGHQFDGFNDWSPALRADGTVVPSETCLDSSQNGETCFVGGPPGEGGEPGVITGLSAHQLSLGVVCEAPSGDECVTGATEHKVWAAMYGATVTVSDPTPPTLGVPSGALWEPGASGGVHKGTESVTISAQDAGGGVQSIVLSADGQPVETYSASCNFTFAQPCPSSTGEQTLTLPTTELSDGTHTLTLVAADAAGNQSTVASEQITVDNHETVACPAAGTAECGPLGVAPVEKAPSTPNLGTGTAPGTSPGASKPGTSDGPSPAQATIHVSETLRGRDLVVDVSGPTTGEVRVGFTGRLAGRTVASGAENVTLRHGRLTATFTLGPRTAAHATIRVSAKLGQELAVTSTLRRDAGRTRESGSKR